MKIVFLWIFLLLSHSLWSQEEICIGRSYSVSSSVLQEERTYWVHLPEGYDRDTARVYPVIYLLDGASFFHTLVGISRTLSTTKGRHLPPCIIVGVMSTDRARDFIPTASAAGRDGKILRGSVPIGGGSERFLHFLTEELCPVIRCQYRTNGQNMLIGHSYAGLFTLHTFLCHAELFDVYLAIDPSLWWDRGRLASEADSLIAGKDFTGKSLYIALATQKRTDRQDIYLKTAKHFISEVMPMAYGLRLITKTFPEENHGSVTVPALYDGIKKLFK